MRAAFTAHGVPSHDSAGIDAACDLWLSLHRLLFRGFIGTVPLLSPELRMVIALSRRYSRSTHHRPAAASAFPAFHVPVFLPLDAFRLLLRARIQRFRRTACNGTWTFITTLFTHPQIPLPSGYCLSTAATFIPVHSEFRQYLVHSCHGHPTPGIQAAPSTTGQLSCIDYGCLLPTSPSL